MKFFRFNLTNDFQLNEISRTNFYEKESNSSIVLIKGENNDFIYNMHFVAGDVNVVTVVDFKDGYFTTPIPSNILANKGTARMQLRAFDGDVAVESNIIEFDIEEFLNASGEPTPEEISIIEKLQIDVKRISDGLEDKVSTTKFEVETERIKSVLETLNAETLDIYSKLELKADAISVYDKDTIDAQLLGKVDKGTTPTKSTAGLIKINTRLGTNVNSDGALTAIVTTSEEVYDSYLENEAFISKGTLDSVLARLPKTSGMQFYKVTYEGVNIEHEGVALNYTQLVNKYNDPNYFLYCEAYGLTFIPSFPPIVGDEVLAFINTCIYGGAVTVSRIIINSENEVKYSDEVLAKQSDITRLNGSVVSLAERVENVVDEYITITNEVSEIKADLSQKVDKTQIANATELGLVKGNNVQGIMINTSGALYLLPADSGNIDRRETYRAITSTNLDYAVKSAMTDGKGAEWTDAEKASARARMGIAEGADVSQIYADYYSTLNIPNIAGAFGNFQSASSWYRQSSGAMSIANNVLTFVSTGRYLGVRSASDISLTLGHVYYMFATVKCAKPVSFSFNGGGNIRFDSKASADFEYNDFYAVSATNRVQPLTITDNNEVFGSEAQVKKFGLIDLTEVFGAGKEPTKEYIANLVHNNDDWFDSISVYLPVIDSVYAQLNQLSDRAKIFKEKKVLIFGDSITETNQISSSGVITYTHTSWAKYAMDYLGVIDWLNLAQDGATFHDWDCGDTYRTFKKQFNLAVSKGYEPDIIFFALGTNDWTHPLTDDYTTVMTIANRNDLDQNNLYGSLRWALWTLSLQYPNAVIYVCTPIQRADIKPLNTIREALIKMGESYCCKIIDGATVSGILKDFETWGSAGRYLIDGLHPNENGKKLMASNYVNEIINKYPFSIN